MGDVIAPTEEFAGQVLEVVLAEACELRPLAVHRHQLRATGCSCALRFDVDSKNVADAAAMVAMEADIGRGLINLGGDIPIVGHMLAQRGERRERSGR